MTLWTAGQYGSQEGQRKQTDTLISNWPANSLTFALFCSTLASTELQDALFYLGPSAGATSQQTLYYSKAAGCPWLANRVSVEKMKEWSPNNSNNAVLKKAGAVCSSALNTRDGRCCQVSTLVLSWYPWQIRSLFPVLAGVSRAFYEAKPWLSQQQELRSFLFAQATSGTAQDIYPLHGLLKVDNAWKAQGGVTACQTDMDPEA